MSEDRQNATPNGSPSDGVVLPLVPQGLDFTSIQNELGEQTDRGAAVLAGSYLEWRIRQAIKHRMHSWAYIPTGKTTPEPAGASLIGTDDSPGKLGFTDQCKLAYCLGLVGPIAVTDLHRLAKIRNRFAHHIEVNSFEKDDSVAGMCKTLETPEHYYGLIEKLTKSKVRISAAHSTMRGRYMQSVQLIWIGVYQLACYSPLEYPKPRHEMMYW